MEKTMYVVRDKAEEPKEELIIKTEMENTPFVIVTTGGKSFGTLGKYKITEDYHTEEQVEAELNRMTWNRIIQIIMLVHDTLTNNKI